MLISNTKAQSKQAISERDLILANALAYVEEMEEKIVQRDQAKNRHSEQEWEAKEDSDSSGKSTAFSA